jgi:hypothetical protein
VRIVPPFNKLKDRPARLGPGFEAGAVEQLAFEGMAAGIGPAISYGYSLGGLDLAAEVKWLPEIEVTNRLSGNILWFKLAISLGGNQENQLNAM